MNENISRLVDGELQQSELDAVCAGLRKSDAIATWVCYHVIGETLRGSDVAPVRISASFAQRFAAEPTILAPRRRLVSNVADWGWAVAATLAAVTVVGWTALSVVGEAPGGFAKTQEWDKVTRERLRTPTVPPDYLLAHQEYSPAAAIQGVGPYLRAVAAPVADRP